MYICIYIDILSITENYIIINFVSSSSSCVYIRRLLYIIVCGIYLLFIYCVYINLLVVA